MKVIAKCWLNHNGVWHRGGEEFEVEDFEAVKDFAEPTEEVSEIFPPEPKRRGRPKKTD